jgi:hypothetical protein
LVLALAPLDIAVTGATARVRFTSRADGDLNAERVPPAELAERRRGLVALPSTWLDEVHGADVVTVAAPGEHDGATADAAVTVTPGAVLGIWVGDCAPVALVSPEGVIGAAHAGWRGLAAGVLAATVAAMRMLGARTIEAHVGPYVHPGCYEFGARDLAALEARFGPEVRSRTSWGAPALDIGAVIAASLGEVGVAVACSGPCTACSGSYWSHRARGELGRQGMVAWLEASA